MEKGSRGFGGDKLVKGRKGDSLGLLLTARVVPASMAERTGDKGLPRPRVRDEITTGW